MGINSAADKVKWAAIHFIELIPYMGAALVSVDQAAQDASNGARDILPSIQNTLVHTNRALDSITIAAYCVTLLAVVTIYITITTNRHSIPEVRVTREGVEQSTLVGAEKSGLSDH